MFAQILERLALALDSAGIPYMVIGGQAVLVYGEPRLTKDIDVTLGAGLERLPEILSVVQSLRFRSLVDPETFTRETMVLPCQDDESGVRIDFIFSFSPYEQEAIGRATTRRIGQADVRYASVEDLLIHKIVAGRPRDMEDAKGVLLKHPEVDAVYVERWLGEFSQLLGEPLVDRFRNVR